MQTWERSWTVRPGAEVRVDQRRGAVRVTGWEKDEVRAIATAEMDEPLERWLEAEGDAGGVHLKVRSEREGLFGLFARERRIDLELQVPFGSALVVDTGSGVVEVSGTRGPVRIDSGSGRVTVSESTRVVIDSGSGGVVVRRVDGDLRLESGSGSVQIEEIGGSATVDVGSGSLRARAVAGGLKVDSGSGGVTAVEIVGAVDVDTSSGNVTLERVQGPLVRVDSGSGRVRLVAVDAQQIDVDTSSGGVQAELAAVRPGGFYRFQTGAGTVNIALPPDAGLTLELQSESGRIYYGDLPVTVSRSEPGELEGVLNGGGARLVVEAAHGVTLRPGGKVAAAPATPEAPIASEAPMAPEAPAAPETPVPPAPAAPPAPPASPAPPKDEGERVLESLEVLSQDAALASSEHIRRVLKMVEEGKLTPEEADEILRALDEGEDSA